MTATPTNADIARDVMATAPAASLATLSLELMPFNSLVAVSFTAEGKPLLLLSNLAVHSRNLNADSRASLLLVAPGGETGDPLAGARLTLTGHILRVDRNDAREQAFLSRNPAAAIYVGFADFAFYEMEIAAAHLVAGFGRITEVPPKELLQLIETP